MLTFLVMRRPDQKYPPGYSETFTALRAHDCKCQVECKHQSLSPNRIGSEHRLGCSKTRRESGSISKRYTSRSKQERVQLRRSRRNNASDRNRKGFDRNECCTAASVHL